jgi:hypothetical protein
VIITVSGPSQPFLKSRGLVQPPPIIHVTATASRGVFDSFDIVGASEKLKISACRFCVGSRGRWRY